MTGRLSHALGLGASTPVAPARRRRFFLRWTSGLAIAATLCLPTARATAGWGAPPVAPVASPPAESPGVAQPAAPAPEPAAPTPAPAPEPAAASPAPAPAPPAPAPAPPAPAGATLEKDELADAGYLPGYRLAKSLSLSPYAPQVGAIPGGVTPGFGAPMPTSNWTFRFNGFLTASLQMSMNRRPDPLPGQSSTVFHIQPQTLDEYASFVGTGTMPGNWAALNFEYGNKVVSATFSLNTWNPSQPSTYYMPGSQYFINNAFLTFNAPPIGDISLRANVGFFSNFYGSLGQYGFGMYQNSVIGGARGLGGTVLAEYAINPSVSVVLEDGIMGNRTGKAPEGTVANSGNGGNANPIYPASWIHHLHLGIVRKGDPILRAQIHYITNWAQDDVIRVPGSIAPMPVTDSPFSRCINEQQPKDGRVDVVGVDATANSKLWGFVGVAASYIKGENACVLRGFISYGGEGQSLTDRWWGQTNGGTGSISVAAINYGLSLGKIVAHPTPFNGDGPDILINAGFVIAKSSTDVQPYDRVRHKYGLDVLYKFLPWLGAGVRGDRVVPTSLDSGETFHVIAPRLVFRSDWQSREQITLLYAKWFYGPRSHPDPGQSTSASGKIDDQLIALNVNIWW